MLYRNNIRLPASLGQADLLFDYFFSVFMGMSLYLGLSINMAYDLHIFILKVIFLEQLNMKIVKCAIFLSSVFIYALLISGCEKNNDYKFVNLSEKLEPEIQNHSTSDTKQIRVAVAAMVSPKETLVYYEELLNYIGTEIGYEVILIQRKTYSEVNELFPKRMIDLAFVCSGPYAN